MYRMDPPIGRFSLDLRPFFSVSSLSSNRQNSEQLRWRMMDCGAAAVAVEAGLSPAFRSARSMRRSLPRWSARVSDFREEGQRPREETAEERSLLGGSEIDLRRRGERVWPAVSEAGVRRKRELTFLDSVLRGRRFSIFALEGRKKKKRRKTKR